MSIQVLSAEQFRQKLAGLVDEQSKLPEMDKAAVKETAIRFTSILASLFSDDLDRKTLWERIGNGFVTAVTKANGDTEKFISYCLDYIKAEPGSVAASEPLMQVIESISETPQEWRSTFLNYISTKRFLILIKARARWQAAKAGEIKL